MNKGDLVLSSLQWFICLKTKPNQTKSIVEIVFGGYFAPAIYIGSLLKSKRSKRCKRRRQKNIQNKALQTKINLYINK